MNYHVVTDGEWVKPKMNRYYLKCCNCGLVHKMKFKVTHHGRGHNVHFQAKRLPKK